MPGESDRLSRAGSYVLGLMDPAARERAERDLENDPAFRDAVFRVAERMHKFDLPTHGGTAAPDHWKRIAARISEMPQMRGLAGERTAKPQPRQATPAGQGPQAAPTRLALIVALGLLAAFAAGYLAALVQV
jgi:anti-sigma-K factor RskA